MRRVNLVRRLWAYQAWKTSGEGGGLAGSLGALLVHLVHQVVPLEVRGGNHQDGVRWGRRAGGRRMGREGEGTLEEAAREKREDLENERQILYLIHSHQMLVILTMIVIQRGGKAVERNLGRGDTARYKRNKRNARSGKEFTESELYNSDFTVAARATGCCTIFDNFASDTRLVQ